MRQPTLTDLPLMLLAYTMLFAVTTPALAADRPEAGPKVEAAFDGDGLAGLTVGGQAMLADGALHVRQVRVTDTYRDKNAENHTAQLQIDEAKDPYAGDNRTFRDADVTVVEQRFDAAKQRLVQRFAWGEIGVDYRVEGHVLHFDVHVDNRSDDVIELVALDLIRLKLPGKVEHDKAHHNLGAPTALRATHDGGQVILANDQPTGALHLQWDGGKEGHAVRVRAGHPSGGQEVFDGVWNVRPIDAGKSDRYRISLRFGGPDADPVALAQDVYDRYREAFPPVLDWRDRRPIGSLFLAGGGQRTEANPRGWGHGYPKDLDVSTPEGRETLRERLLILADRVVKNARGLGLQGVIVWDMEGAQYPHPTTYIGEPRVLKHIAPEMDVVVDDFYARLREGGIRYGMTLRPTLIRPRDAEGKHIDDWENRHDVHHRNWVQTTDVDAWKGLGITAEEAQSPLARLDHKIQYAKQRWGATVFYVDTPYVWRPRDRSKEKWAWASKVLNADVFTELAKRHPDVLIIPEHGHYPRYWAAVAPYYQLGYSPWVTPPAIRATYPEGFVVQNISNDKKVVLENPEPFKQGLIKGDTFLVHSWWGGQKDVTVKLFREAAEAAPLRLQLGNKGEIRLQRELIENVDVLGRRLRELLDEDKPLPQRRVYVQYEVGLDPAKLNAAIEAILDAGGVIAWAEQVE